MDGIDSKDENERIRRLALVDKCGADSARPPSSPCHKSRTARRPHEALATDARGGKKEELGEMLRTVHRRLIPNLALRHGGEGGECTAGVCAKEACRPPVTGAAALGALLDELDRA